MGIYLIQEYRQPKMWGNPKWRYDDGAEKKFDFSRRTKPYASIFRAVNKRVNKKDKYSRLPTSLAIALADLSLGLRGQVGLVLGSLVNSLYEPPEDIDELDDHKDCDVLILNPHSPMNPAPHEWGVDWFVRPEGRAPTNSSVDIWYDVALQDGVRVVDPVIKQGDMPIFFNPSTGSVEYKYKNRDNMVNLAAGKQSNVPAGLYLPDSELMDVIINHCESKGRIVRAAFEAAEEGGSLDFRNASYNINRMYDSPQTIAQIKKKIIAIAREKLEITQCLLKLRGARNAEVNNFRFKRKNLKDTHEMARDIVSGCRSALESLKKVRSDYGYLEITGDPSDALLPVLPSDLLQAHLFY